MELLDSVVWNNTNNGTDGSDEATGIELMGWKGRYWWNQWNSLNWKKVKEIDGTVGIDEMKSN